MSKNLSFKPGQTLTAFIVVGAILLSSGKDHKLIPKKVFGIHPAFAQRISPGDIWQKVYQQLPDLPRENKYISKDTGQVAENNTLASRLIIYHIYRKGRTPNYRLDWKLTLADYLDANEIIYHESYPGNDTLRQNPIEGDRAAISRLNRHQRNALVQVLADIFNPNPQNTQKPTPETTPTPNKPQLPQTGGAELLK
ncbi:hypothetical protein [Nodularia sphaerocarpa]|uniref:hypothetical protein n=1 Tax=Nodularia sphaerocarpa TaxID=137816 RepID=UPI001EFB48DE|nr:hypothetical protein [Nodularia sphaerocarpa]MDB9375302.1 hypothetical protein [Nodularia sphaerocarpa CS-585]ULP72658.1 hypothetical protein BDGGKGIB_02303 [Nodularia sphaerocarpa UHCC 0038]